MNTENRDVACAAEVGRMAELGRFDSEFRMFGCAYMEAGKVYYRAGSNGLAMYRFADACRTRRIWPTSVIQHVRRSSVPAGMAENIAHHVKLELIDALASDYPRFFFESLEQLGAALPTNDSLPFLEAMRQTIEGHFDAMELQLVEGTLARCYHGLLLDRYEKLRFHEWLAGVRRQMEDDPVPGAQLKRTFYGFCYERSGRIRAVFDAVEETVLQQHAEKSLEEHAIVAPVLQQTCWLQNFGEMGAARAAFKRLLMETENADYFTFLKQINQLPSAIDAVGFDTALADLEAQQAVAAVRDLRRYGRLWNVFS